MLPKYRRFASGIVLAALLAAGCLPDSGDEPSADDKKTNTSVTGGSGPASAPGTSDTTGGTGPATPDATGTPVTPASVPGSSPTTATAAPTPAASAEPNVIKGTVRDEQGDPVAGAKITAAGYTASSNKVESTTTDAAGRYRLPVVSGLYNVRGEATVAFEGKSFILYLHPADGNCEQMMSAGGIVQDFVLRLTGLEKCRNDPDPKSTSSYTGATVDLSHAFPRTLPGDATVTVTLTPTGPLADGGAGKPITFTRTVTALDTFSGPSIENTRYLHDIPLGRYSISGFVTLAGGARQDLKFGSAGTIDTNASTPAASYAFSFDPVKMVPFGIRVATVMLYEPGATTTETTSPPATSPPSTSSPTTAPPTTPSTCWSQYVGPIPC